MPKLKHRIKLFESDPGDVTCPKGRIDIEVNGVTACIVPGTSAKAIKLAQQIAAFIESALFHPDGWRP